MNWSRRLMDCGASVDAGSTEEADAPASVPVLLQRVAQLEEEKTYLRSVVCELLRKNERLREQAHVIYPELQSSAKWVDQAQPAGGLKPESLLLCLA